ncbi:MAG: DUF1203 domain-containing protein [Acidobacteriota bacterium]|nr:DUF1203 domain-containing protein [Acidobacteriota bacterium]
MSFQIHALAFEPFQTLFSMTDEELADRRAKRMIVDSKPGFPCRVSLDDAEIGETVILTNFEHLPSKSPYRSSHAIFVREHAKRAFPAIGEIPESLTSRLISVRAFDNNHEMVEADVVEGEQLFNVIPAIFKDPEVDYLHLHNAKPGCFAASVTRADSG